MTSRPPRPDYALITSCLPAGFNRPGIIRGMENDNRKLLSPPALAVFARVRYASAGMAEARFPEILVPELPTPVTLTRCDSGAPVQARLVEMNTKLAKTKINGAWWVGIGVSKNRRREEGDHHWDWAAEVGRHHNKLYFESVAIQTADDAVQGAAIYRLDGRSVVAEGAGAVLLHWLATAPRNRPWLVARPGYRGAGKNLIRWAAYHSYQLGFGGRIVLATLPSPRTVAFYESLGFVATSAEESGMVIYELGPERANTLIIGTRAME
jgi:hypothetical protein